MNTQLHIVIILVTINIFSIINAKSGPTQNGWLGIIGQTVSALFGTGHTPPAPQTTTGHANTSSTFTKKKAEEYAKNVIESLCNGFSSFMNIEQISQIKLMMYAEIQESDLESKNKIDDR